MPEQVVNAASYVFGPIAPGIIVSLFASDLGDASFSARSVPLPVELGGTRITADDIDCPLYYVGPNQANFQVPFEVQGDFVDIEVIRGQQSRSVRLPLSNHSPGLFRLADGTVIVTHAQNSGGLVGPDNPAQSPKDAPCSRCVVSVWGSGFGATNPAVPSRAPATPSLV